MVWDTDEVSTPESASEQDQPSVTSVLFQPLPFFAGLCPVKVITGAVASYLKLYVALPTLPAASVQVPVTVAPPESGPL